MSPSLSKQNISEATELISNATSIVITSHKNPDGDAIGSALAMYHMLKSMGKKSVVVLPDDVPDFLKWPDEYDEIVIFDKMQATANKHINEASLIFILDYNHLGRVTKEMEVALRKHTGPFIMIDHHQEPEVLKGVIISDIKSCSTCQLVYEFAVAMQWSAYLNNSAAECLYLGIMTDSGSFRFPSVTPQTHRIVASLIEGGLDHARIHREVYDTNLQDRLKLIGYALNEKLEVIEQCATAIISLTADELKQYNHKPGDTEGLVNQALSIKGIKLAAFFREGNNEVKISFRSKGNFDVNSFARKNWRGGGHSNAAGGSTQETMEDALHRFRQEVIQISDSILNS